MTEQENEKEIIALPVLPHETIRDAINRLGAKKKEDPEGRYRIIFDGVVINSWDRQNGPEAYEFYEQQLEIKKMHMTQKKEELDMASRILNPSDAEKAEIERIHSELTHPHGAFITAKRAYEKGQKPEVQMGGQTITLDSPAAFAKYQQHMWKDYDKAVLSAGGGYHAAAFRDRGERFLDLYEGMIPAMIAAEQVKLMQDTIWKTSKETHQVFRDPAFLRMVERGQFTLLGDEMVKAANGQENIFDKSIIAGIKKKSELQEIGMMFITKMGDSEGEMRGDGLAAASNITARIFRMAFVDEAVDAMKKTNTVYDQQYLSAVTDRDNMVTSMTGASDGPTQTMLRGVDVGRLAKMGPSDGAEIDTMKRQMQANLNAQNLDPVAKQSLQDRLDKLFSSTVNAMRLNNEKDAITYRVRELEEKDKRARDAIAEEKENKGK